MTALTVRSVEEQLGGVWAPVRASLTGIVNVFECSAEARATLESAKQA